MNPLTLTENVAFSSIRDFFREKPLVIFGTGMSCAIDIRFGMGALSDELIKRILPESLTSAQRQQWAQVSRALDSGDDLETALVYVADIDLLQMVKEKTGDFISGIDREFAHKIAEAKVSWPASALIKRIVEKLPEGDPTLHIVTPNYDTLFEHACDLLGITYTNGFMGTTKRCLDWDAADRSLRIPQMVTRNRRRERKFRLRKHARLHKVHGSLSYFFYRNEVIENNAWMWDAPTFASRVIVTPGLTKYESLQNYRNELQKAADEAIDESSHFLFLGYGFNDSHLETYIRQKLTTSILQRFDCDERFEPTYRVLA